jgi:hypothetical protein
LAAECKDILAILSPSTHFHFAQQSQKVERKKKKKKKEGWCAASTCSSSGNKGRKEKEKFEMQRKSFLFVDFVFMVKIFFLSK